MQAFKYIVNVDEHGQIVIPKVPQIKSTKVEIIILPLQTSDEETDLTNASESSIDFWDNPIDEVWNDV